VLIYGFQGELLSVYLPVQGRYHAHRLTIAGNGEDAFTQSLTSARVEMNPHQVNAALFALKSPFAKGVLLADEVGLGKTIEAGLVMSQRWAERRRRILLVVPASLRKQWQQELIEKFSIHSVILDAKTYGDRRRAGTLRPFEAKDAVVIVSYEFAARKADDVRAVMWDLVVFDEAHRLRNVHKKTSKRAKTLKDAVEGRFKILLTATPLQNSLTELYGIVSMIDEMHFGGENAFKAQYMGANATPASQQILRERLSTICHRTLRRQVQEAGHINFRQRHAVTFQFDPHDVETELYEQLSEYLQNPDTIAYGSRTNALVILQARKSLGSSTAAVAGYLDTLLERLRRKERASAEMTDDFEDSFADEAEQMEDEDVEAEEPVDPIKLAAEIAHVEGMRDLARDIGVNGKGEKLIANLPAVLDEIQAKGGQRKAVIFTESVRTQRYISQLLSENGYADRVVLMNGSNNDPDSRALYSDWKARHADGDKISGSKTADMKAAIVEAFKSEEKSILIATESGAEGINLQFCSLLINYDLPWNPQRVEQRIGRCHRYGQLVDVTVVNMLNLKNRAEARIHELLEKKLHLFEGVFGASDEVLGILTDGIDFEREVLRIVQSCRSAEEADREFDLLTERIQDSIDADMEDTRAKVLESMDGDVIAKLHRREKALAEILPEFQQRLLMVAQAELSDAHFPKPDSEWFDFEGQHWTTRWPMADEQGWHFFRVADGLGQEIVARAKERDAGDVESLTFEPAAYPYTGQLGGVLNLTGRSGWLRAFKATMPVQDAEREDVLIVAETDDGEALPSEVADKMMMAPARSEGITVVSVPSGRLDALREQEFTAFSDRVAKENYVWLEEKEEQLGRYARDREIEIEAQVATLDVEIRDLERAKRAPGLGMEEKLAQMREIRKKETVRDDLKLSQFETKRKVNADINRALDELAALLDQKPQIEELFTLRWTVA
jgi:ERCC4-related helicase